MNPYVQVLVLACCSLKIQAWSVQLSEERQRGLVALLLAFKPTPAFNCLGPRLPADFGAHRCPEAKAQEGNLISASNEALYFRLTAARDENHVFLIDAPKLLRRLPQLSQEESLIKHTMQFAAEMNLRCVIFCGESIGAWECGRCAVVAGKRVNDLIQRDALWLRLRHNRNVYVVTDDKELGRQVEKYNLASSAQQKSSQSLATALMPEGLPLSSLDSTYDALHFNSDGLSCEGVDGLESDAFIEEYVRWAGLEANKKPRKDIKALSEIICG